MHATAAIPDRFQARHGQGERGTDPRQEGLFVCVGESDVRFIVWCLGPWLVARLLSVRRLFSPELGPDDIIQSEVATRRVNASGA